MTDQPKAPTPCSADSANTGSNSAPSSQAGTGEGAQTEEYIPAGHHVVADADGERFVRNAAPNPAPVTGARDYRELEGRLRRYGSIFTNAQQAATDPMTREWGALVIEANTLAADAIADLRRRLGEAGQEQRRLQSQVEAQEVQLESADIRADKAEARDAREKVAREMPEAIGRSLDQSAETERVLHDGATKRGELNRADMFNAAADAFDAAAALVRAFALPDHPKGA